MVHLGEELEGKGCRRALLWGSLPPTLQLDSVFPWRVWIALLGFDLADTGGPPLTGIIPTHSRQF